MHNGSEAIIVFLSFWDLYTQKLLVKMMVKLTPGVIFMNVL